MDILCWRVFLLTNFQPEIAEFFLPDVDFVYYTSLEEAKSLAEYYLTHEEERIKIARNGYETIKQNFTYEKQLKKIFDIVKL